MRLHGQSLKHRYFSAYIHIYQNIELIYVDLSCEGSSPVIIQTLFVVPALNTELPDTLIVKAVELYAIARLGFFFKYSAYQWNQMFFIPYDQREDIRYTNIYKIFPFQMLLTNFPISLRCHFLPGC